MKMRFEFSATDTFEGCKVIGSIRGRKDARAKGIGTPAISVVPDGPSEGLIIEGIIQEGISTLSLKLFILFILK